MAALFKRKLTINQGSTFVESWTWSAGTPAAPVNLTGCTARMHIRSVLESPVVLCELTTENGGITLGGTAGTIVLTISATATALFTWATGVYDVELIHADSTVERVAEGAVVVSPEVTR